MNKSLVPIVVLVALASIGYFVVSTLLEDPQAVDVDSSTPTTTAETVEPTLPERPDVDAPTNATSRAEVRNTGKQPGTQMKGRGAMSGLVLKQDGSAIDGVEVKLFLGNSTFAAGSILGQTDTGNVAMTDASGNYLFENLPPKENYVIVARKIGFARGELSGLVIRENDATINPSLVLKAGAQVTGRVMTEADQPIAGADVEIIDLMQSINNFNPSAIRTPTATTKTDNNGAYRFESVDFSALEVVVKHPNFTSMSKARNMPFAPVSDHEINFTLREPASISGIIYDDQGDPIADAKLAAFEISPRPDSPSEPAPITKGTATTLANGTFAITNLRRDSTFHVTAEADGYSPFQVGGVSSDKNDLQIILRVQGGAKGRVVTSAGQPVTEFTLRPMLVRNPNPIPVNQSPTEVESRDGAFELVGLDPGMYLVEARAKGFAATRCASFQVKRGIVTPNVEIVMEVGGSVVGRVYTSDGEPISGSSVTVRPNGYTSHLLGDFLSVIGNPNAPKDSSTKTDGEGAFQIDNISKGTWQLEIRAEGRPPLSVPEVVVNEGETTDVGSQFFPLGGTIRGTCRTTSGKPFGTGYVQCNGPDNYSGRSRLDGNGNFEFNGLLQGEYKLSINPESINGDAIGPIDRMVIAQQTLTPVRVIAGQMASSTLTLPDRKQ